MMNEGTNNGKGRDAMKTYKCRCHVCGKVFEHKAGFLSGSQWPDGLIHLTCNAVDQKAHPVELVRDSYNNGSLWIRNGGKLTA